MNKTIHATLRAPVTLTPRIGASLAVGLFCASALTLPAWAAAASGDATSVGEVIVTAEKHESTVQKTAASLSVLTGAQLQAGGVFSASELAQLAPGVSVKTAGPGQTEFELRGLTSTGGESPTVGFYLDDAPLTPPAMAQNGKVVVDPNLYDLARVEVLRGPQGTLYGAGSMGGTIRLVTNQPNLEKFEASAEFIGSGTDGGGFNHTESGMLNIPLIKDVLALRLVGSDTTTSGWIDRIVLNPFPLEVNNSTQRGDVTSAPVQQVIKGSNEERQDSFRAVLTFAPNDRFSVTPSVMWQKINQNGPNTIDNPPGNVEAHYQPYDVAEPFRDQYTLAALTTKYDFGVAEATSATAYWTRDQFQTQDISEAMQDYIGSFFGPAADFPYSTFGPGSISEADHTDQWSEELRFNSKGVGPFTWLAGGYYSSFNATSHVFSYYPAGGGFDQLFGSNNLADNHRQISVEQFAGFGEASYAVTSQFKATAGLRYFSYTSHSVTQVSGVSANGTSDPLYSNASNAGVTPKFNLSFQPTDDLNFYATVAKGFRPGGPNSPIPVPPCSPAPTSFGPDSVWSYEAGEKARFLDRRVSVNGSVYFEDWTGVQQQFAPACGFKYTTNAGAAHVYGAELEVVLRLTDQLTLSQNAGYTHAAISSAAAGSGLLVGQKLQDVPDWTANTTLQFATPINDRYTFIARANNSYVGSMLDLTYALNTVPSYDLIDLRAGVRTTQWTATLFMSNVANKRAYLGDTGALSANVPIFNRVTVSQPRTIGVDLTFKY